MPQKSEGSIDLSSTDYDFSQENSNFKEKLRIEFWHAVCEDQATPLSDEDFADLNAAGEAMLHLLEKKRGNSE